MGPPCSLRPRFPRLNPSPDPCLRCGSVPAAVPGQPGPCGSVPLSPVALSLGPTRAEYLPWSRGGKSSPLGEACLVHLPQICARGILRAGTLSPLPSLIQVQLLRLPTIQFPSPRASQPMYVQFLIYLSFVVIVLIFLSLWF